MSPSTWGPPIWTLFHTLANKIKEDKYPTLYLQLYNHIVQICYNLPCDTCSNHARTFLYKVKIHELKKKSDLKNLLYVFHNSVNKLKDKKMYNYEDLEIYDNYNIITTFNNFTRTYHTKGNMKLLASSFHRTRILHDFRNWLLRNISSFHK